MATELLIFQRFVNREVAQDVLTLLAANGINGKLTDELPVSEGVLTFQSTPSILLLLAGADFERARELLRQATAAQAATVEDDHYLFGFTDVELYQIVAKSDEWSALDVAIAQRLLKERGQELPPTTLQEMAASRTRELAEPRDVSAFWMVFGYLSAALGGLLGVVLGWFLSSDRTTLPDGRQVPTYSAHTRFHGRVMLILGGVVFTAILLRWIMVVGSRV